MTDIGIKYPLNGNYPNGDDCRWTITRTKLFSLKFLSFDVETHDTCRYDYVQIEGEKYCNKEKTKDTIDPVGKSVLIRFRSDSSTTKKGFRLQVVTPRGMTLI